MSRGKHLPFMEKNTSDSSMIVPYIYLFIFLDIPLFCLTVVLDSSSKTKKELPYGRSKRDEATASRLAVEFPW